MDTSTDHQSNHLRYYFSSRLDNDEMPVVEAHKVWSDGHEVLPVSVHDSLKEAFSTGSTLMNLQRDHGLEMAMHEAERLAVDHDLIDPRRSDGRMFTEGPPDPFTTLREQELAGLKYTYDLENTPQGTVELNSIKSWKIGDEQGYQAIALGEYDRPADARSEQQRIQNIGLEQGLEAEMREVERIAVENGSLRADRADPRLFTDGPADPFSTRRAQELESNHGYYFHAGPALDSEETIEAHTLDLVKVESVSGVYQHRHVEYMRVEAADAGYLDDAAGKFNHMMQDANVGTAAAAAVTWAREHGVTHSFEWQETSAHQLDRRPEPTQLSLDMDTEPMPAAPDIEF